MDKQKLFSLGVIGCGRISQAYFEAIKKCPQIKLSAVMDIRKESAESVAELMKCSSYGSVEALINNTNLDGVVICTPPRDHCALSCLFMENGISVLCEKPLAMTVEEGKIMVDTAEKNGVTLMMASKFRYVEDIIRAKSMISSGVLGDVQIYQNQFCSQLDVTNRWNIDPEVSGGGVLMDNGTHSLDLVHYLLGRIKIISVQESMRLLSLPVEETVQISFVTESSVTGTIHLSWAVNTANDTYIDIFGVNGAIKLGWQQSYYLQQGHLEWLPFGEGYQKIVAFRKQLENFVDTVNGKSSPLITPEQGLESLQLVATAYEALRTGDWVTVNSGVSYAAN